MTSKGGTTVDYGNLKSPKHTTEKTQERLDHSMRRSVDKNSSGYDYGDCSKRHEDISTRRRPEPSSRSMNLDSSSVDSRIHVSRSGSTTTSKPAAASPRASGLGTKSAMASSCRSQSPKTDSSRTLGIPEGYPRSYDRSSTRVLVPGPKLAAPIVADDRSPRKTPLVYSMLNKRLRKDDGVHHQEGHHRTESEQSVVEDVHATNTIIEESSGRNSLVQGTQLRKEYLPVERSHPKNIHYESRSQSKESVKHVRIKQKPSDVDRQQAFCHQGSALASRLVEDEKNVRWRSPLVSPAPSMVSSSSSSRQEHTQKINDLERELRAVVQEKAKADATLKDLQRKYDQLHYQNGVLRDEKANYKHDINELINVIGMARTTGKWDIDDVTFRALSYDQVFGRYEEPKRSKSSERVLEDHIEDLKCQLSARDDMIDQLRTELNNMRDSHKETMTALHSKDVAITNVTGSLSSSLKREEAASSAASDRDQTIMRLQANVRAAENQVDNIKHELQMREEKIMKLEMAITELNNVIAVKDSESANHIQTVKVLQDRQRETASEVSLELMRQVADCEETIQHLKTELSTLRDHYDRSHHDCSHLERRIQQLESDLHATQDDKRKLLDEIGALQNKLRDSQVSSHDHHEILKSELLRRDETIQKLRKDVLHFQEKRDAYQSDIDEQEAIINDLKREIESNRDELQKKDERLRHAERAAAESARKFEDANNEGQTVAGTKAVWERPAHDLLSRCQMIRITINLFDAQGSRKHRNPVKYDNLILQKLQVIRSKFVNLEAELQTVRAQHADSLTQVADRHDAMLKLKENVKELEEKHKETLATVNHRGEVIKQLRDELKQNNHRVEDLQQQNLMLDKELTRHQSKLEEAQKEIDRLQTHIQKVDLSSSQMDIQHRGEITEREEKLAKCCAELKVLEERLSQQQQQVSHREDQIAALQSELRCKAEELNRRERHIQKLEVDLTNAQEDHRMAVNELERREITLQQLEADLGHSREQYREAIEENGRLEARIQAFVINAQSEQDLLSGEVKRREEAIQKLKLDNMNQKEIISKHEEQIHQQEKTITQLKMQIKSFQGDITVKDNTIADYEAQLKSARNMHAETKDELAKIEEHNRELQNELGTANARLENLEHNLSMKEDLILQLKQDTDSLQQQQRDAISKITARDEAIQHLNSEIGKLRQIRQEKLIEIQRQSETIKRLQEALTESHVDLDETRKRVDYDICESVIVDDELDPPFIKQMTVAIKQNINKCYADPEIQNMLLLCTVLDPRFLSPVLCRDLQTR
ncbi:hypothetical protein LSH36_881g02026 [Paralvinella palmiformis]|uniref:t-SNARE coiled-coil homology domain-containing protein n=1 Tax=Paralvinella palmiformis TaxID=53620 RepID=A0AAD9MU36_9ANNE|nr:hypothetical protein LSH36_881g02026 [Paralvinella palmiformis]